MVIESIRRWSVSHPRAKPWTLGGLVVLILLALYLIFLQTPLAPLQRDRINAYYMDEETGDIVIDRAGQVPPLPGRSGRATVVHAVYYTCSDEAGKFLAYLEKFTPESQPVVRAEAESTKLRLGTSEAYRKGLRIRRGASGSPWVSPDSPEGRQIVAEISMHTGPHAPLLVTPP